VVWCFAEGVSDGVAGEYLPPSAKLRPLYQPVSCGSRAWDSADVPHRETGCNFRKTVVSGLTDSSSMR
jgi:hypothetical protein